MSLYLGTNLVSGVATNTIYNAHDLFDFKWIDHELTDQSWLRADTYSWQSGEVYVSAYNHLVNDWANATHAQSETIAGYTIYYALAQDGHKLVDTTQLTTLESIYTATGVAWYYVLDTANTRFKLPRTKFGFTGYRDTVGKYVAPGLPNITGEASVAASTYSGGSILYSTTGSFTATTISGNSNKLASGQWANVPRLKFNASDSNSIYGNSTTVQPPATQMYLYFYVGQFSQTATEQTAGLNAELFNGKADIDGSNMVASVKNFDGQWVNDALTLVDGGSAPTTDTLVLDVSSYLPNDNYNYEVLVDVRGTTGSTSGNQQTISVYGDALSRNTCVYRTQTRSSSTVSVGGSTIVMVGSLRTITVYYYSSNTGTYNLRVLGYRRIGTNS